MAFPDLYKQSIYFEIYNVNSAGEAQFLQESMAFSVPPSSIDIIQPQRVTKTQTPGGYFIDNYGLDGAQITINGETGNDESRLTILGNARTPRNVSGQDSYFEFRNRIERYSLKNENYIMKFYDLTHKGTVNIFRTSNIQKVAKYSEAWEVVLDESALRRSAVKPFFYPYSISLTGIRPLGTFNPRLAKNAVGFLSNVREAIDSVTDAVDQFNANLDKFLSDNFEFVTDITDIFASVSSFTNQLTSFTKLVVEYEQKLGGLFDSVISSTSEILSDGLQLIAFPYDALETARVELVDLRDKTENMITSASEQGKAVLDKYDWEKTVDPVSELSQNTIDIENPFNEIMKTAKQGASYEPIGGVSVNGVVQPLYGFTPVVVQGNTRLDKLARDFFGDPDQKDIISAINGIYSNDELISGTILDMPILSPNTRYANNAVYNIPGERDDILGRDAKVDDDGRFVLDPSDYAVTGGDETVLQSVIFKISEKRDRQIRDGSYGIVSQIGSALNNEAPFELLGISLQETLIQDPRITDVYGLNFFGDGDITYQEFKFDTITKTAVTYKDAI